MNATAPKGWGKIMKEHAMTNNVMTKQKTATRTVWPRAFAAAAACAVVVAGVVLSRQTHE